MKETGLNMDDCRSQSYDGAGNMAGIRKGLALSSCFEYPTGSLLPPSRNRRLLTSWVNLITGQATMYV